LLSLILPLFALILMGWLTVRLKLLDEAGASGLSGFAYSAALPALLFSSIVQLRTLPTLTASVAYLSCCIVLFGLTMAFGRLFLGPSLARTTVLGLNATYGNVIFLGTPIVSAVFGPKGVSLALAIIGFHSGVLLPMAALLIELDTGRQGGIRAVARRIGLNLLRNPIILSICAGLAWHGLGIPVPPPLHRLLSLLAQSAAPLALFSLGCSLPPLNRDKQVIEEAVFATALKLVVLPLLVGVVYWQLGLSGMPVEVGVLIAAMPTGANAFLLARRTTAFAEAAASTVVLATAVSVFSIAAILTWVA